MLAHVFVSALSRFPFWRLHRTKIRQNQKVSKKCRTFFNFVLILSDNSWVSGDNYLLQNCLSFAEKLAPLYHFSRPPYSLREIANELGIVSFRERLSDRNARLVLQDGRPTIEVNPLFSLESRRFSVAHEMGHVVVNVCAGRSPFERSCGEQNEERLCDRVAEALLTPREAVERFLLDLGPRRAGTAPPSCSSVRATARTFGVPIDIAARRIFQDLALAPSSIAIIWKRSSCDGYTPKPGGLRISDVYCPKPLSPSIPLDTPASLGSIVTSALSSRSPLHKKESLSLGSLQGIYPVEAAAFLSTSELGRLRRKSVLSIVDTRGR
jgi:Zn-dependent peptidase ImmA (M78 family)